MTSHQLQLLIKSLIVRQPDRFIHLIAAIEAESSAPVQSLDGPDALAEFIAAHLDVGKAQPEQDVLNSLAELCGESGSESPPGQNQLGYMDPPPRTSIQIPSEEQLRSMARDILERLS